MIEIDVVCWKQICQHAEFSDEYQGGVVQHGDDTAIEYLRDGEVVARMMVYGANTDRESYLNERKFWCTPELKEAVSHIVILTEEDWAEWDELDGTNDREWLREKGVL